MFFEAMKEYAPEKLPFIKRACPCCGAKHPTWSYHDSYPRYLISYEAQSTVTHIIEITRIACSSCEHTHAILPEVIIPHSSYCLPFVLSVLKDYFSKMKVKEICEKYQISASMLYGWKRLFLKHKKIWLGVLEDMYHNALEFLVCIPNSNTSKDLSDFFLQNNYSFLQWVTKTAFNNTT